MYFKRYPVYKKVVRDAIVIIRTILFFAKTIDFTKALTASKYYIRNA